VAAVIRQGVRGPRPSVIKHQRTAKWTAITDRLAGTHAHTCALSSQVSVADALAGELLDLHGMQEVRGSNPHSSTVFRAHVRDQVTGK